MSYEHDETSLDVHLHLGCTLYQLEQYEKCVPFFKKLYDIDPENLSIADRLAQCCNFLVPCFKLPNVKQMYRLNLHSDPYCHI